MGLFSKRVIPESQLLQLNNYSFNPGNFTYIDNLMLKTIWEPTVKRLPMTLDGIDGMQARKLKLSSPLGQLLDHGTDALVSAFFCYFTFLISPNGFTLLNAMITVSALINTAAVNWQEETFGTFSYTNSFFIFGVSEPLLSVVLVLFVNYFYPKFWLSPMARFFSKYKVLKFLVKYVPKNLDWFTAFLYLALALSLYTFLGFPYEMYNKHRSPAKLLKLVVYLLFNGVFPPLLTVFLPPKLHGLYSLFVSSLGGFGVVFIIISNIRKSYRRILYPEFYLHYLLIFLGYGLVLARKIFGFKYDKLVFNCSYFRTLLLSLTVLGTGLGLLKAIRTLYEIKIFLELPFFTTKRPKKTVTKKN